MSDQKLRLKDLVVKRFSDEVDVSGFDCSEEDELGLNEFIHKEALAYQNESMGITYLFYFRDEIVGYVTVSMGSIRVKGTKLRLDFFDDKVRYPALLLGRLGVANKYRKRNIGKCMCLWSVGFAKNLSTQIGCRFIVLSTQCESRIIFYKKCGFKKCPSRKKKSSPINEENVLMYFQLF